MYVVLAFGSNIGNRAKNITNAIKILSKNNIKPIKISKLYKNQALLPAVVPNFLTLSQWNKASQMYFLNCVGLFSTSLNAFKLLELIEKIEKKLGKKKLGHWLPRKIDIDIIFYENLKLNTKKLTIPHKEYKKRAFVLRPLRQIKSFNSCLK